jgi:hypothetical protein
MKRFVILFFFGTSLCLPAYQSFAQEYLVTVTGDTLHGKLKPLMYGTEKKIQITGDNKKKTVYSVVKVRGYVMGADVYHTVKGPTGYTFMKLIKPGFLSLYGFQQPNQVSYDGRFLLKKSGVGMELPNLGFKKAMSKFLSDCESVVARIDQKDLGKGEDDLYEIIDAYNLCVENKTKKSNRTVQQPKEQDETPQPTNDAWNVLEGMVQSKENFTEKADVLEMIRDVQSRVRRNEKIPNYLIEGLKGSLSPYPDLKGQLDTALQLPTQP